QGDQKAGRPGQGDIEILIEQGELGNDRGHQIGNNGGGHDNQEGRIHESGDDLFADAGGHFLVGDVIFENTGEVSALFSGQYRRGIHFGEHASFGDGLGEGLALADAVANLGNHGTELGG